MSEHSKRSAARRARVQTLATKLYREDRGRLLSIARRNAANPADAEEALQDAFALFIDKYDPKGGAPPIAWLALTLKRRCWAMRRAEHLDRRSGQESADGDAGVSIEELPSEASGTEEAIGRAEELLDARKRLARLKPDERRALVLFSAGYSYREIAAANRWTYTKTNRAIAEGRAALRGAQHA